jgi:large subunit ribosomal protein L23
MRKNIYSTVIRPLITEKSTHQSQKSNAYAFQVAVTADKAQIKQAIEKIYEVKVKSVRTANRKGKRRRAGYRYGLTSQWKKAVVILHADYHIDLF